MLKGLIALVPTCLLLCGSAVLFFRRKAVCSFLQLFGASSLVVVVLTHLFEALNLFPFWLWSFLLTYSKPLTCFLGCIGGPRMALVIISISGVLFSASRCFP